MKRVIVTGAAGFLGSVLVEELLRKSNEVWAILRKKSLHNVRIYKLKEKYDRLHILHEDLDKISSLKVELLGSYDCFFHLAWTGDKTIKSQNDNLEGIIQAVELAKSSGCWRFIATGSQAEYGVVHPDVIIREDLGCFPITAYGTTKLAACYLSKTRARELGLEWIWARIFSLIGKYEPRGRMLPDLYCALCNGDGMSLTSCEQNWDYLDVYDAADALIYLAECGRSGEIYNIADGAFRPLKRYTEELRRIVAPSVSIHYGRNPNPYISLQPSVEKIKTHTGWNSKRSFADSIADYNFLL